MIIVYWITACVSIALAVATVGAGILTVAWLVARARRDRQRAIGYGYGSLDGYRLGLAEGRAAAKLDAVLDAPTEAQHYAGIVSAIPDAQHYADTMRMDTVRRAVQGKESQS